MREFCQIVASKIVVVDGSSHYSQLPLFHVMNLQFMFNRQIVEY